MGTFVGPRLTLCNKVFMTRCDHFWWIVLIMYSFIQPEIVLKEAIIVVSLGSFTSRNKPQGELG